jgi:hypothetical protein
MKKIIAKSILVLLGLGFLIVMYLISSLFFYCFIFSLGIVFALLWCIKTLVD